MSDIFFGAEEELKSPIKKSSNKKKESALKPLSTIESLNLGNVSREVSLNTSDKGLCKIRPKAIKPSLHNPRPDWSIDDEWLQKHVLVDFEDLFETEMDSSCLVKIKEVEEKGKVREEAIFPDFSELVNNPDTKSRKDFEFLVSLAKSIREVGQVQPIEVETDQSNGAFVVLEGHLRRLACILGRVPYIEAVRNEGLKDLDETLKVERQITENSVRKNLSPYGVYKLASHFIENNPHIKTRELAEKLKISQTYATYYKNLVVNRSKISPLIYIALEKDLLSSRVLQSLLSTKSIKAQEKLLTSILGKEISIIGDKVGTSIVKPVKEGRKRTVSTMKVSTTENCLKAGNRLISLVPDLKQRSGIAQVSSVEDMDQLLNVFLEYLLEG